MLRDFLFEPDLRRLVEPVDESEGHGLGRGGFFFPARKKQARKDDGKSRPLPGAGDFPNDLYRAEVRVVEIFPEPGLDGAGALPEGASRGIDLEERQ